MPGFISFASPFVLLALIILPIIWYLLRLTPPQPDTETFPPSAILKQLRKREQTAAKTPWWLTLLRLALAALIIVAMAGPILNPHENLATEEGTLLLVIDDDWTISPSWQAQYRTARGLLDQAERTDRPVLLLTTARADKTNVGAKEPLSLISAGEAARLLEITDNSAAPADHLATAETIAELGRGFAISEAVFLSNGMKTAGTSRLLNELSAIGNVTVARPGLEHLLALRPVKNLPEALTGQIIRPNARDGKQEGLSVQIIGRDENGVPITSSRAVFSPGETTASYGFDEPIELRNQITRIDIEGFTNAGAVRLLDDNNRRRLVGLLAGETTNTALPLLSPFYYVAKALAPFADVRLPASANFVEASEQLIAQNVSAIVTTDIGQIPDISKQALDKWVKDGGTLIHFAGPKLAANPDNDLLPVKLHPGDRRIGGAFSWDEPKQIAAFEAGSPFFGLKAPAEVLVTRQVLAEQNMSTNAAVWARLADGTPLVSAAKSGNGWLVLFHVNANNSWSNLPLSGVFVEMLRRMVHFSRSTHPANAAAAKPGKTQQLPPLEVLSGKGELIAADSRHKPLEFGVQAKPQITKANPPGFYGSNDGYIALNLIDNESRLEALVSADIPTAFRQIGLSSQASINLRPLLLAIVAILFIIDCLIMFWLRGGLKGLLLSPGKAVNMKAGMALLLMPVFAIFAVSGAGSAMAQSKAQNTNPPSEIDFSAALVTRLAYVKTGNTQIDNISHAGLYGLSRFIASRTSLEPGEPVGIDIDDDELAFYPILYWPISTGSPIPGDKAMARVDAYMKQGGTIIFDTRDELGASGFATASPANAHLRKMLQNLDIPPLEPVPKEHVLTKSFYILHEFPGRYATGKLWVERTLGGKAGEDRPVDPGDGVSSIIITSNDFAGAWAVSPDLRPLLPTVPADPFQREMAFRSGVNIMMYMLTGNYKSDQVHIPAILERLGQ